MIFHLSAFTLVNITLCALGHIRSSDLATAFFMYEPHYTWPIYLIAGIGIPIAIGTAIEKAKQAWADRSREAPMQPQTARPADPS